MKNLILIATVLAFMGAVSCKSKEKSSSGNNEKTTDTVKKNDDKKELVDDKIEKARLVVSFSSIGTGIDSEAFQKMEKFVKGHPKHPKYKTYSWGREGETDVAFSLSEIKTADQPKFIEELKAAIGASDRVQYHENEYPKSRKR